MSNIWCGVVQLLWSELTRPAKLEQGWCVSKKNKVIPRLQTCTVAINCELQNYRGADVILYCTSIFWANSTTRPAHQSSRLNVFLFPVSMSSYLLSFLQGPNSRISCSSPCCFSAQIPEFSDWLLNVSIFDMTASKLCQFLLQKPTFTRT
jgi:hypothetical protein